MQGRESKPICTCLSPAFASAWRVARVGWAEDGVTLVCDELMLGKLDGGLCSAGRELGYSDMSTDDPGVPRQLESLLVGEVVLVGQDRENRLEEGHRTARVFGIFDGSSQDSNGCQTHEVQTVQPHG